MSDSTIGTRQKLVKILQDAKITKINQNLSNIPTLDENLTLIQYLTLFLSQQFINKDDNNTKIINIDNHQQQQQQLLFNKRPFLIAKLIKIIVTLHSNDSSNIGIKLSNLTQLLSDYRIFIRLFGIIPLLNWAQSVLLSPPNDLILKIISYCQVVSNLIYQPLENVAYLSMHDIISISPERQNQLWIHSSKLWAAHVLLDFARLYRTYQLSKDEDEKNQHLPNSFYRSLIEDIAYLPLTIHWSTESGLLTQSQVGFFGTIAGIVKVIPQWSNIISS